MNRFEVALVNRALARLPETYDPDNPRSQWSPGWAKGCVPDFIIGRKNNPQVLRWYVFPRNWICNVYLHCFLRSDEDFALHSHPWIFNLSYNLMGSKFELTPGPGKDYDFPVSKLVREGTWSFRWNRSFHRIMLAEQPWPVKPIPCWTIFITGPKILRWERGWGWVSWGFACGKRFIPFKKIVKYETGQGSEPQDGCPE